MLEVGYGFGKADSRGASSQAVPPEFRKSRNPFHEKMRPFLFCSFDGRTPNSGGCGLTVLSRSLPSSGHTSVHDIGLAGERRMLSTNVNSKGWLSFSKSASSDDMGVKREGVPG